MEALQILEAPEQMAYLEHEVSCPFCESTMLCIIMDENSTYYKCGYCENDWAVLDVDAVIEECA